MSVSNDCERVCLEVFGLISASVTHEIRNCLAIVNETAGLLEDLAMMVGSDGGLPVERVNPAAASVMKQVDRADDIMRDFNVLSHSVDEPVGTADCKELVALLVRLSRRQAALKNLNVQLAKEAVAVTITADIAVVESLVYLGLLTMYNGVDNNEVITVGIFKDDAVIQIQLEAVSFRNDTVADPRCVLLAEYLKGGLAIEEGQVLVSFPQSAEDRE